MKAHQVTDSGLVAIDENAAKIEALKNGAEFRCLTDFAFSWSIGGTEGDYHLNKIGTLSGSHVFALVSSITDKGIEYSVSTPGETIFRTINLSEISFIK